MRESALNDCCARRRERCTLIQEVLAHRHRHRHRPVRSRQTSVSAELHPLFIVGTVALQRVRFHASVKILSKCFRRGPNSISHSLAALCSSIPALAGKLARGRRAGSMTSCGMTGGGHAERFDDPTIASANGLDEQR